MEKTGKHTKTSQSKYDYSDILDASRYDESKMSSPQKYDYSDILDADRQIVPLTKGAVTPLQSIPQDIATVPERPIAEPYSPEDFYRVPVEKLKARLTYLKKEGKPETESRREMLQRNIDYRWKEGLTPTGLQDTPFNRAFEKYFPYLEAAAGIGLIATGAIEGIKSVKDLVNLARVGKVVQKISDSDRKILYRAVQEGRVPKWMKGMTGRERAELLRGGKKVSYEYRPLFDKLGKLFRKTELEKVDVEIPPLALLSEKGIQPPPKPMKVTTYKPKQEELRQAQNILKALTVKPTIPRGKITSALGPRVFQMPEVSPTGMEAGRAELEKAGKLAQRIEAERIERPKRLPVPIEKQPTGKPLPKVRIIHRMPGKVPLGLPGGRPTEAIYQPREQIESPELLGQAQMPTKRLRPKGEIKPIEGEVDEFEKIPVDRGEIIGRPKLPPKLQSIAQKYNLQYIGLQRGFGSSDLFMFNDSKAGGTTLGIPVDSKASEMESKIKTKRVEFAKPKKVIKITPKPEAPVSKQPWEMTKEEFKKYDYVGVFNDVVKFKTYKSLKDGKKYKVTSKSNLGLGGTIRWREIDSKKEYSGTIGEFREAIYGKGMTHKGMVHQALSEGKPVPPEVLKDYPELVNAEIDRISSIGRERMNKATQEMRGLNPTEYDWLSNEERQRIHELQMTRPTMGQLREEAKKRVLIKRAERKKTAEKSLSKQPISFYDKNEALRTGRLLETTDKGARVEYQGEKIFVPKEKIKKPEKLYGGGPSVEEIIESLPSKETRESIYQDTINRMASIENTVKKAKSLGAEIPMGLDAGKRAREYLGLGGKVKSILENKTYRITKEGNIETTGEGLRPILKDYDKQSIEKNRRIREKDLNDYLIAKRIIEDLQRPKSGFTKEKIVTPEQVANAQKHLDQLEKKYKKLDSFEGTAKRLYDFQKRILHNLVDAGIMSEDLYQKILSKNKYYVPFQRIMDAVEPSGGSPRAKNIFTGARSPVKKIKGSERAIHNITESIIKNTYRIMDVVERNTVAQGIAQLKDIPGIGIEEIRPQMVPVAKISFKAAVDQKYLEQVKIFAEKLGAKIKTGGQPGRALGYYHPAGKTVERKFATPEEVVSHEVGHFLDDK